MALKDRREARDGARSLEDREMQSHLAEATRALEKALSVCGRVASARPPTDRTPEAVRAAAEVRMRAASAKKNQTVLRQVLGQLQTVHDLKSSLTQDMDLLPEDVLSALSRERSLKRRAEAHAKKRVSATESAVQNVLNSLATVR